jgi:hypothetical protein
MKHRRQAQSSALSFIDCICCGFGAVLLLFILTAKSQIVQKETEATQALAAVEVLQEAIAVAEEKQKSAETELASLDPQPDTETISLTQLDAEIARLSKTIEEKTAALAFLDEETEVSEAVAASERPSADKSYLSGLRLQGPRVLILLENSGSMLAQDANSALEIIHSGSSSQSEKWLRAKAAVRAVLAAIPKGTKVAILQMNQTASLLSGTLEDPYMDPYDNSALITTLDRLDALDASGGANLLNALTMIRNLGERPSSLLLIGDGLPTAPNPTSKSLSETDRIRLFNQAMSARPNFPFNVILFPFEGDPSAAGLFWKLGSRTNGITLIPDNDWPAL